MPGNLRLFHFLRLFPSPAASLRRIDVSVMRFGLAKISFIISIYNYHFPVGFCRTALLESDGPPKAITTEPREERDMMCKLICLKVFRVKPNTGTKRNKINQFDYWK